MISVVEQAGFQFKVAEGDLIRVPSVDAEAGTEIKIDRVLLIQDGETVKVGTPEVSGAEVRAQVVSHGQGKKVLVVKKQRREDYKRHTGHRQGYSELKILKITL
jgi:large subunit ribosomal protein L21